MTNIKTEVSKDGKELTIKIDLTQEHGLSASKKNTIIASTQGNQGISLPGGGGTVNLGLNCYKKAVQ